MNFIFKNHGYPWFLAFLMLAILGAPRSYCATIGQGLFIVPVKLLSASRGISEKSIDVLYQLPCGWSLEGFYLQQPQPERLFVGAVARRKNVFCLGLDRVATATLPFATGPQVNVYPLRNRHQVPIDMVPRLEHSAVIGEPGDKTIRILYQASSCQKNEGLLLSRSGPSEYAASVVAEWRPKIQRSDCTIRPKILSIAHMKIRKDALINLKSEKITDLAKASKLASAPVLTAEVRTDEGLHVSFLRRCNEAPIGVVLSPIDSSQVEISVLVARFYNMRCKNMSAQGTTASLSFPEIAPAAGVRLKHRAASAASEAFALVPAAWIKTPRESHKSSVGVFRSCDLPRSIVIAHNPANALSLAGLSRESDKMCNRDISTAVLDVPIKIAQDVRVVSLRLATN